MRMTRSAALPVGRHWLLLALLVIGATVRVMVMLAYRPALFFSDSWSYLSTAFTHHLVTLPYLRPVGYPVLIRILMLPARDVGQLVAIQHLAGLALGTAVYVTLVRAHVTRTWAAAAAALVLLDGYAITLEQYVMPDTLFALTLLIAVLALGWPRLASGSRRTARVNPRTAALAGLLLAAAAIQREVGLFAIPVVIVYLLWTRASARVLLALLIAIALPLATYATLIDAKTGVFGLTATSGWTLYSRVAGFADCAGTTVPPAARALCETPQQRAGHPTDPSWYMWAASSPAVRRFHRPHETPAQRAFANATLARFARRIAVHQPGALAGAVARDFASYFLPGATPYGDSVSATSLPRSAARETVDEGIRRRVIPGAHPSIRAPARVVRAYRSTVHVPRPVLALLALAAVIAVALRSAARREILLFAGTALALLLGTAATAGFGIRYLLPAVPLLAIGGGLACHDLATAGALREPTRPGTPPALEARPL